jgi:hypothetical protein
LEKKKRRAKCAAWWQGACLACMRPWFSLQHWKKAKYL